MKLAYPKRRLRIGRDTYPSPRRLKIIELANQILAEYAAVGLRLSMRQLYLQFVVRGHLPDSPYSTYLLIRCIQAGRSVGLVAWDAIREIRPETLPETFESPAAAVKTMLQGYRRNCWATQPVYVEVFIDRQAQGLLFEDVLREEQLPFLACTAHPHAQAAWRMGYERFRPALLAGKRAVLLYIGDYDPLGLDIEDYLDEKINLYTDLEQQVEVRRVLVTREQAAEYKLTSMPVKMRDNRAKGYVKKYGQECWRVDSMPPLVATDLLRQAVHGLRDQKLWDAELKAEQADLAKLQTWARQLGVY